MIEDSITYYSKEELELWLVSNNSDFSIGEINKELDRREMIEDMAREPIGIVFQDLDGLEDYNETL
jgi:hypothetical protein